MQAGNLRYICAVYLMALLSCATSRQISGDHTELSSQEAPKVHTINTKPTWLLIGGEELDKSQGGAQLEIHEQQASKSLIMIRAV